MLFWYPYQIVCRRLDGFPSVLILCSRVLACDIFNFTNYAEVSNYFSFLSVVGIDLCGLEGYSLELSNYLQHVSAEQLPLPPYDAIMFLGSAL